MDKINEIITNSGCKFTKNVGMFKTTYYIDNLIIEVSGNHLTITNNKEHYSTPITEQALIYLKELLK